MKRLIIIVPLIIVLIIGGCYSDGTKDGYEETITNIETVTDPFLIERKIADTITELVIEITTLIEKTQTNREVEQTTHITESTMPAKVADMIEIINNYRIKENLNQLKVSDFLCVIAKIRAKEASIKWSHTRPNGKRIDSLLSGSKFRWSILGENLARHKNATAEAIVNAWLSSDSHRKNLLNPRYKFCGIAEYQNDEIRYISIILTD